MSLIPKPRKECLRRLRDFVAQKVQHTPGGDAPSDAQPAAGPSRELSTVGFSSGETPEQSDEPNTLNSILERISELERVTAAQAHKITSLEEKNRALEAALGQKCAELHDETSTNQTTISQLDEIMEKNRYLEEMIEFHESKFDQVAGEVIDQRDKLEELMSEVEQLQQNLNNSSNNRSAQPSGSQPSCSPFQYWTKEACNLIGTKKPEEKSTVAFRCFEDDCAWQNKKVTLNAYILHLKRKPHNFNVRRDPDIDTLPKLQN